MPNVTDRQHEHPRVSLYEKALLSERDLNTFDQAHLRTHIHIMSCRGRLAHAGELRARTKCKEKRASDGRPSGVFMFCGAFGGCSCLDKPLHHLYIAVSVRRRGVTDEWRRSSPGGTSIHDHRCYSRLIQRASDGQSSFRKDVGADHCCPDITVAQQFPDGADIVAHFQQLGCERMPERMPASVLCDS